MRGFQVGELLALAKDERGWAARIREIGPTNSTTGVATALSSLGAGADMEPKKY